MRLILTQPQLHHGGSDNFERVLRALEQSRIVPKADDVLLLPERVAMTHDSAEYRASVRDLATSLGCAVVGGSHHEARGDHLVNAGLAVDREGNTLGMYEKVRPYALERREVSEGAAPGEFSVLGKHVFALICADFWFSDLFAHALFLPHLILVPALSVSRKATPDYSRALWRHLAIARAYEFGAFVGVSDWGYPSELPLLSSSGVGGLADPSTADPEELFRPIAPASARAYELDFEALEQFRHDRLERGFFWRHK